ncbi:Early growth response 1 [Lecanosticta acicola]|uniref:Early growth response 1 n=1 Tax=Lecanosticta acicola TaxID=111012 RepID=A0AAI8Z9E1_9PEZI|nr:Early growth response 1 [Lecanosticta acicola]
MSAADAGESHGTNPFVCNVCQKTYGRIDHLARHFRSHTNEKPFRCVDCGKTFARADLLKRHATLHTSTEQSGKKRKMRASQACAACATIKVKCDQEKPCKRCKTKGLECRVDSNSGSAALRNGGSGSPDAQWSPQQTPGSRAPVEHVPLHTNHANTYVPQMQVPTNTHGPPNTGPMIEDPSLTDFLSNVFHPTQAAQAQHHPRTDVTWNGNFSNRDLMDFSQDLSMDFHDLDTVLSGNWDPWLDPSLAGNMPMDKPRNPTTSEHSIQSIDESINLGSAAYKRSAFRWIPNHEKGKDNDQTLASILIDGQGAENLYRPGQEILAQPLSLQDRDKMVALLLASCDKVNYQRIVALFPGVKVLDIFLNDHLLNMEHSIDSWFHVPTFRPAEVIPELLTLMVAHGAVLSKSSHAQRLGYALHDKSRVALWELMERDNSYTRSLQALQAYAIRLDLGTWSGNKRTMVMAESAVLPLVTMIRRSGGFRRSRGAAPGPTAEDAPASLEQKWRTWVEAESFKRLAYHVFIYCVQVSISFQTPPVLSYAEVSLELPAPQALWRAKTAQEWREQYFALGLGQPSPSFVSSMCDASIMGVVRHQIDLELTLYLVLLSHWCLAWEFTQLSSANKAQASADMQWAGTLLASSKCQELRRLLDSFYVAIEDWNVFVPKEVHMMSQLLRMNLCVAFGDLQILAGKEGEEEARRVLPSLKQWYRSPECREALWHAGQVLRAARRPAGRSPNASRFAPPDTPWLRDFNAIALYHAGLAFWVYGLLSRAIARDIEAGQDASVQSARQLPPQLTTPAVDYEGNLIRLDGDDEELSAIDRHRFIGLNKGRAVISAKSPFLRGPNVVNPGMARMEVTRSSRGPGAEPVFEHPETVPLDHPRQVMEVVIHALAPASQPPESSNRSATPATGPQRPAMVENLIQLMRDLGEAASSV